MVDRFHVDGNHLSSRQRVANLGYVLSDMVIGPPPVT